MQNLPFALPLVDTSLERVRTPLHVCVQSVHESQSLKTQSTSSSPAQETSWLHIPVSLSLPVGAAPHALAGTSIDRVLYRWPPPHVAEQWDHGLQGSQMPSSHPMPSQGVVLQGATSCMAVAVQGAPP